MLALCAPTSPAAGVIVTLVTTTPVPVVGVLRVANAGSEDVSAIGFPPVSVATTFRVIVPPAFTVWSAMGDTERDACAVEKARRIGMTAMRNLSAGFMGPPGAIA